MKLGLQTISWGSTPMSVDGILACAQTLGCEGVELAQIVDLLGSVEQISDQASQRGLRIAGLAGGSLRSRIPYAAPLGVDYLYIDEWDENSVREAIERGLTVAVHPHFCKSLSTVESVRPYLDRFPDLRLILDCAHQYLANDDVVAAMETYHERVISIHLKDWHPRFGKSPQHFARGFTHLGGGVLGEILTRMVLTIKRFDYQGWVIIEHDSPPGDPCEYAKRSREWLRTYGI
jgi:sugar phosphate isomerase/epimerase